MRARYIIAMLLMTLFIVTLIIVTIGVVFTVSGEEVRPFSSNERKVIILLLDRVNLKDVRAHAGPIFQELFRDAGVGLMNVNTAGRINTENSAVTLGAGSRGYGDASGRLAFGRHEEYEGCSVLDVYARHLGRRPGEEEIIHPFFSCLENLNSGRDYPFMLGALGEALRKSGVETALIGNSDTYTLHNRWASMIIMDQRGNIAYGEVGKKILIPDSCSPFGCRANPEALWKEFVRVRPRAGVIVIDWGDTFRLDKYKENLSPGRREELLAETFRRFDKFLSRLKSNLGKEDLVMIITPSPPLGTAAGKCLTPAFLLSDNMQDGLLYSPTTRRPGLITSIDIAPTVLGWMNINKPYVMLGGVITTREKEDVAEFLLREERDISLIYKQRPFLLKTYVTAQIIALIAGLFSLQIRFKPILKIRPLLISLLLVPLVLHVLPLIPFYPFDFFVISLGVIILSIFVFQYLFQNIWRKDLHVLAVIGLVTASVLALDLLTGANLIKSSYLGYDPIAGARFYGIGNEFMGVMIGSSLLGGTVLLNVGPGQRFYYGINVLLALMFSGIILLMASPRYGANFGGTITSLVAFSTTFLLIWPGGPRVKKHMFPLAVLALVVVGIGLTVLLNVFVGPENYSHLGRFFGLIRCEGWSGIVNVMRRKLSMNLLLIRYSIWSRVLITTLVLLAILFYRPVGLMKHLQKKKPLVYTGFIGIIVGGITAFAVNDSGVVAAATTTLYVGLPLLFFALEEAFTDSG